MAKKTEKQNRGYKVFKGNKEEFEESFEMAARSAGSELPKPEGREPPPPCQTSGAGKRDFEEKFPDESCSLLSPGFGFSSPEGSRDTKNEKNGPCGTVRHSRNIDAEYAKETTCETNEEKTRKNPNAKVSEIRSGKKGALENIRNARKKLVGEIGVVGMSVSPGESSPGLVLVLGKSIPAISGGERLPPGQRIVVDGISKRGLLVVNPPTGVFRSEEGLHEPDD